MEGIDKKIYLKKNKQGLKEYQKNVHKAKIRNKKFLPFFIDINFSCINN